MGQFTLPPGLEIVGYIISAISTFIGIFLSFYLIQKAKLENQKIRLETKKLELEVLEKEKKLRGKRKLLEVPKSDNKLKSVLGKVLLDIQAREQKYTDFLMGVMRPFKIQQPQKSSATISSQRIIGSLIEFVFLCLFLYTGINQTFNTFPFLFPKPIPPFLTNLAIPLFISSAGTSLVLGLIISDLLGFTNLTSWTNLRENRKFFLPIILATLIISVVLSSLLALSRLNLIQNSPPIIVVITSLADSLFIIPTLLTGSFLTNGMQGIIVLFALELVILRFPITILRKFLARIIYYVSD